MNQGWLKLRASSFGTTANRTSKYKSKFYHIYTDPEVKPDLNRKVQPHIPLPDLVGIGYYFLGKDWLETAKKWREEGNVKHRR